MQYLLKSETRKTVLELATLTNDHANGSTNGEELTSGSATQFAASSGKVRATFNILVLAESYNRPKRVMLALCVERKIARRSQQLQEGPV